jgi:hypothetical protein
MPYPITLLPILLGTALAPRSGRLRPLLAGRPHLRRRLGRWGDDGVVRLTPAAT